MAEFDVAILGGGNGGYAAALRAAQLGLKVALIEKDKVGGTCLHRGCIPTKALLQSAEVIETVRKSGEFGILSAEPSVDWGKVLSYKESVVTRLYKGLQSVIKARKVTLINGKARIASPTKLDVEGGEGIGAKAIVLATGSYARSLPFIKIDGKAFITSDEALTLDDIPSSVIIIGAGAIGLEFASVYAAFGSAVTLIEALPRLAPLEDEEVSKEISRQFQRRGVKSFVGVSVTRTETGPAGAVVTFKDKDGNLETVIADRCLVAVGRGPVSEGLGYEEVGVKLDKGFVVVDGNCRTGVDGVWALGDLITQPSLGLPFGHFQLAHVAFAEGIYVAEQIAGVETTPVNYLGVPRATYSHPEIASVGLTESQAKEADHNVKTTKFNWAASGKATILGDTGGFVKVVAAEEGPVLGVHMVGPRVTELISEAQLITNWEAVPAEVASLIHPHPTLSEATGEALLHLAGKQLHGA